MGTDDDAELYPIGQRKPFKPPIKFQAKLGLYWIGVEYYYARDGWLINVMGFGVFIPSERLRFWRGKY